MLGTITVVQLMIFPCFVPLRPVQAPPPLPPDGLQRNRIQARQRDQGSMLPAMLAAISPELLYVGAAGYGQLNQQVQTAVQSDVAAEMLIGRMDELESKVDMMIQTLTDNSAGLTDRIDELDRKLKMTIQTLTDNSVNDKEMLIGRRNERELERKFDLGGGLAGEEIEHQEPKSD